MKYTKAQAKVMLDLCGLLKKANFLTKVEKAVIRDMVINAAVRASTPEDNNVVYLKVAK